MNKMMADHPQKAKKGNAKLPYDAARYQFV